MYPQTTAYECGPYALKHALLTLGVFTDERRLALAAGTGTGGTDETQLARAAERTGCTLPVVRTSDAAEANRVLAAHLDRGNPTLLCVDQWEHWVAVVGRDGPDFVLLDSAEPQVIRTLPWSVLAARWGYRDSSRDGRSAAIFDAHPVIPQGSVPARARFTRGAADFLAGPGQARLMRDWSVFARELLGLVAPASPGNGEPTAVALADLLRERWDVLLRRAATGDAARVSVAARALGEVRVVSATYGLRVLREKSGPVLAGITDLVRRLLA